MTYGQFGSTNSAGEAHASATIVQRTNENLIFYFFTMVNAVFGHFKIKGHENVTRCVVKVLKARKI